MGPEDMPKWESDFWAGLMDDMNVGAGVGGPDAFFYANGDPHYGGAVKTYWTPDTLVGEIVEEGDDVQLLEIGTKP